MKRFFSAMWLIALLGVGMTGVSSCANDEEDPTEEDAVLKLDDVNFVKRSLLITDADGNYTGLQWGVCIDKDRPTTAFVGVEEAEEIQQIWEGLIPYDVTVKTEGGDKVAELTDTNGTKQGEMRLHAVNDGEVLAEINFSTPTLIDAHVSQIVFIPADQWPHSDLVTVSPLPTILERKTTGEKYALVREPSATGKPGYYLHVGHKRYFTNLQHKGGTAPELKSFPSTGSMRYIAGWLGKDENKGKWDVLAKATETPMTGDELKETRFFTSHNDKAYNYYFILGKNFEGMMVPLLVNQESKANNPEYAGVWHYTSRMYKLTEDNGSAVLLMDHAFQSSTDEANYKSELKLTFDDFNLYY